MNDSKDTMRDQAFCDRLLGEAQAGRAFSLASILATRDSMPRGAGARLAVLADGSFIGTVGGGRIEQIAIERGHAVLAGAEPASLVWETHERTGMACGGDALLGVCRLEPAEALPYLRRLSKVLAVGSLAWVVEHWDDPAHPRLDLVDKPVAPVDPFGTDPAWSEATRTYVEPIAPDARCYVYGGGHVGQALVPLLASTGWVPVVVDDRPELARPEVFPAAREVRLVDFRALPADLLPTARDYAVVLTHGHMADVDVLAQVVPCHPAYVGCIGSRRKAAFARDSIVARGVVRADADAVHLPIGEDILAVTPAEIAVSITAQMIRCRAELRPVRPHQPTA